MISARVAALAPHLFAKEVRPLDHRLICRNNRFIEYRYDIVNSSFPFTQLIASPDHGDPTHQLLASYMYSISVIPVILVIPVSFAQLLALCSAKIRAYEESVVWLRNS